MTTPDQVLNDLRAAITRINDGDDSDARFYVGVLERAAATIEALTQKRVIAAEPADAGSVLAGDMPDGVAIRPATAFSSCDFLCRREGMFMWLTDANDREVADMDGWWKWHPDEEAPIDLPVVYLGIPPRWSISGLRELIDAAAITQPHARDVLLARGVIRG